MGSTPPEPPPPATTSAEARDRVADADERQLEAVLRGSRVVTAVLAGSLARTGEAVTVLQLRVLVLASTRPDTTTTGIAEELGVHASSASRTVDRLVTAGLVQRSTSAQDRRRVDLTLTEAGERLLEQVMADRRRELGALMATMSPVDRAHLAQGMSALAAAAGEPPVHAPLPF